MWHAADLDEFRKLDINTMNSVCASCHVRNFCGGGCRAVAHLGHSLSLTAPSPKCSVYKTLYISAMWFLAEHPELAELRHPQGLAAEAANLPRTE